MGRRRVTTIGPAVQAGFRVEGVIGIGELGRSVKMSFLSTIANDFLLSLEGGLVTRSEIIQWADIVMASEPYDDRIVAICLAKPEDKNTIVTALLSIADSETYWDGVRRVLGRAYWAILKDETLLPDITRFFDRICIRNSYDLPADLHFLIGLEDSYDLARLGHFGSVDTVRAALLTDLSRYKHQTEQDAAANP